MIKTYNYYQHLHLVLQLLINVKLNYTHSDSHTLNLTWSSSWTSSSTTVTYLLLHYDLQFELLSNTVSHCVRLALSVRLLLLPSVLHLKIKLQLVQIRFWGFAINYFQVLLNLPWTCAWRLNILILVNFHDNYWQETLT